MKTPLDRSVYKELESIVGAPNLSEDDGIVLGYAWNGLAADPGRNRLSEVWPSAIIMPGSTEEVQAIVKCCVRNKLRFRALSTGVWSMNASPGQYLILDLRRMNRCEIDAKNQMAIIEPYVTALQLQNAALREGLTCHIVGAGPPHSPLASATSVAGIGVSGATTGVNYRNLLALEWVTPEGEIKRIGSSGSDVGWFNGEGPGPGFRGMIRGDNGAYGGIGVFTKIGFKLHPWKDEAKPVKVSGAHPQLGAPLSERQRFYHLVWDDWEKGAEAAIILNKSRVADFWLRIPPSGIGTVLTADNGEYLRRKANGTLPVAARDENTCHWSVLTLATSDAEMRYKERVMAKIIADTGAKVIEMPKEEYEVLIRNLVTSTYVLRVWRPTFGSITSIGGLDNFRMMPKMMEAAEKLLEKDAKKGHFVSADAVWTWANESRHMWAENVPVYSTQDRKASAAAMAYFVRMTVLLSTKPFGMNGFAIGPVADLAGGGYGRSNEWMRKIKNGYDPKGLSIGQHYVFNKQGPLSTTGWRLLGKLIGARYFQPILKFVILQMLKRTRN
ncbi:hypothetical protein ASF69_07530 [Rhizobium sp. Leaf311]|uniref:FAD-binding oxidoreductase n=1 Tax=Rhizobium sp. Leaf311 TaxID=1736332 RepID=UPI000713A611|nr:FAD-binding oxidoreductase [Rhizobium sp. Leaf311]KQQ46041.1 hypothetical protein ASF69_07530 [Rhizobium sp. Leaf311]